jgi:hypothetical protein
MTTAAARHLGHTTKRLLVALHVLFAGLWVGGIAAVLVITYLLPPSQSAEGLVTRHTILDLLDFFVIIPACFGSLFTGLAFMRFTPWGFLRYRWVIVKWVSTVTMIAFGALCLGPWIMSMARLAGQLGLAAPADPTFRSAHLLTRVFIPLQLTALLGMILVSIFKPWGKRAGA